MSRPTPKAVQTAVEVMQELREDPEFVRGERVRAEQKQANVRAYAAAAAGVLAELRGAGFEVATVGDLRAGVRYAKAIPILISWLDRVTDEHVQEDIVRSMSVPWGKAAGPTLVAHYRNTTAGQGLRWAIANALEVVAGPELFDDLVELALDPNGGQARQMLALAVARTKAPGARAALMRMLDDELVAGHAISGLVKLKAEVSREQLEPFVNHPIAWVRKEAKKLLPYCPV